MPNAQITIVIRDLGQGKVEIKSDPTFETMAKMINSGEEATPAHGYALAMVRRAREISQSNKPVDILIPRIGR